jgi:hypothetical protein
MKEYKLINNITGWLAFAIAAVTYLLTIEPTASFWDCGEFIATAFKLEVGHPPGAPFFMLTGRFFALFASDPSKVAMMVNAMSALMSAFTILFLFWTITHLARKIIIKDIKNISTAQIIAIMGSGLVGALAYTFSDTFWFSAVEAEVYAYSSLFTAVVFWAILKWEDAADFSRGDRWLIFIAYLMGLSIGVHLLNLLAIPAIVLVYYFKNYETSFKGITISLIVSCIILGVIMYGFIPGSVGMASWFELFFVNSLGMPYNFGALVYVVATLAILAWAVYESYSGKNENRIRISFILSAIILGIPFIGGSVILPVILIVALTAWLFMKDINRRLINTIVLSLTVLFIGYSSYSLIVIRSLANPAMDQNSPDNMFALKSYLNREQYGSRPLFYGQYYNSDLKVEGQNYAKEEGEKIWVKDTVQGGKDRYISTGRKFNYVYAEEHSTFFPRMYSSQENHKEAYISWGEVKGRPAKYRDHVIQKPTFSENLRFFFNYQVNFMYWRYFMWNFSGRQNDIQGHGEVENGNWITGFDFIDNYLVGDQSTLPPDYANNKGHNVYFMLPLLLGLLGIFFMIYGGKKGVESFWVTFLLFLMTGLAIVVYLNQAPYQPRERDYAYAASFYAFAIWIGFGVLAIIKLLNKAMPKTLSATIATALALLVPVQMASQNWDDHNRSKRHTMPDFAWNYLISTAPNSIIFTNGDNDTFPLWYLQKVEGLRTDVRVCNLSYLNTDWYIDQMKRGYYDSEALPIKMGIEKYLEGVRTAGLVNSSQIPIIEDWINKEFELGQALKFYSSDSPNAKDRFYGENYMPSRNLYLLIDSAKVLQTGTIKSEDADKIVSAMPIKLNSRLMKNEYAILDMLYNNNWERPIYYAHTVGNEANLGLNRFSQMEGIARRIIPVLQTEEQALNTDIMYENMMEKFRWGNIEDPKVYLDETNLRMCHHFRVLFGKLAETLIAEEKNEKALNALNHCLEVIPVATVPSDYSIVSLAESYYKLGKREKGDELLSELLNKTKLNLDWFFALDDVKAKSAFMSINQNLFTYQEILGLMDKYDTGLTGQIESSDTSLAEDSLSNMMLDPLWMDFFRYSELYKRLK